MFILIISLFILFLYDILSYHKNILFVAKLFAPFVGFLMGYLICKLLNYSDCILWGFVFATIARFAVIPAIMSFLEDFSQYIKTNLLDTLLLMLTPILVIGAIRVQSMYNSNYTNKTIQYTVQRVNKSNVIVTDKQNKKVVISKKLLGSNRNNLSQIKKQTTIKMNYKIYKKYYYLAPLPIHINNYKEFVNYEI